MTEQYTTFQLEHYTEIVKAQKALFEKWRRKMKEKQKGSSPGPSGEEEIQSWIDRLNRDPKAYGIYKYMGVFWSLLQKINPIQKIFNRAQRHSYVCGKIAVDCIVCFKLIVTGLIFLLASSLSDFERP